MDQFTGIRSDPRASRSASTGGSDEWLSSRLSEAPGIHSSAWLLTFGRVHFTVVTERAAPTPGSDRAGPTRPRRKASGNSGSSSSRIARSVRVSSNQGLLSADDRAHRADSPDAAVAWVIAQRVREYRNQLGLTVEQLAERSGISKGMLSKIENAQASPSLGTLVKLAGAISVPLTSLFRGLEEEQDALVVRAGQGVEIMRKGSRVGQHLQPGSPRPLIDRMRRSARCVPRSSRRRRSSVATAGQI